MGQLVLNAGPTDSISVIDHHQFDVAGYHPHDPDGLRAAELFASLIPAKVPASVISAKANESKKTGQKSGKQYLYFPLSKYFNTVNIFRKVSI